MAFLVGGCTLGAVGAVCNAWSDLPAEALDGIESLLDNFEHLMAAATLVTDLLSMCPRVKVLVTSREVLHLHGEQQFSVPPLALPGVAAPHSSRNAILEDIESSPAVKLFVQSAQAAKELHQRRLVIYRELADTGGLAEALSHLGMVAQSEGEYRQAAIFVEESLARSK